jgi:hypothetical protein
MNKQLFSREGDMAICHPDRPAMSRGMCNQCYKKWLKNTPKELRPIVHTGMWRTYPKKKQATCHPDKIDRGFGLCNSCYQKQYRKKNIVILKIKAREKNLKKYNLTIKQRDILFKKQGGKCAICQKEPGSMTAAHIDHCHKTGKVRGILCNVCNWYLGKIDRDPTIINRIIKYRNRI